MSARRGEGEGRELGPFRSIDDEWRSGVLGIMTAKKISRSRLARLAGVSLGSLSQALNPERGQKTFRGVDRIHEVLECEPPTEYGPARAVPRGERPAISDDAVMTIDIHKAKALAHSIVDTMSMEALERFLFGAMGSGGKRK